MKQLIILFILVPFLVSAQTEGEIIVGDVTVQYDSVVEIEDGTLYYLVDSLMLSEHNGVTLLYKEDVVIVEAHDTDSDGLLDSYLTLDENEDISTIAGKGASFFERPQPLELSELIVKEGGKSLISTEEDLVASLNSITIPKYHNWKMYGLVVLFLGGGFWWYRRRGNQ